jgi:hypothetical protein
MNLLKNILITLLFLGGIAAPALAQAIQHCDSAARWEDCDCNDGEEMVLLVDGESWCEVRSQKTMKDSTPTLLDSSFRMNHPTPTPGTPYPPPLY